MSTEPTLRPVTTPDADTSAIVVFSLDHDTRWPSTASRRRRAPRR
jgi:hypothetical protein